MKRRSGARRQSALAEIELVLLLAEGRAAGAVPRGVGGDLVLRAELDDAVARAVLRRVGPAGESNVAELYESGGDW